MRKVETLTGLMVLAFLTGVALAEGAAGVVAKVPVAAPAASPASRPVLPPLAEPDKDGFIPVFNGKDLAGWVGAVNGYGVENGVIYCKPEIGGNLYTAHEFYDFIVRFEFKLPPGANNGLGIRAPLKGDAAYVGMELQIRQAQELAVPRFYLRRRRGQARGAQADGRVERPGGPRDRSEDHNRPERHDDR
jgi:hypothetical protein